MFIFITDFNTFSRYFKELKGFAMLIKDFFYKKSLTPNGSKNAK